VEVNGFDYFDTVKGELISGGKAKIADVEPGHRLRRAQPVPAPGVLPHGRQGRGLEEAEEDIRAELDESTAARQFHGTVSLPFAAGDNRMVAVKIVDDRGIESLKVMRLDGTPTPAA
jgi:adenine-specific DNA-methyltransferase